MSSNSFDPHIPASIEEIVFRFNAGESAAKIARALGVKAYRVQQLLRWVAIPQEWREGRRYTTRRVMRPVVLESDAASPAAFNDSVHVLMAVTREFKCP